MAISTRSLEAITPKLTGLPLEGKRKQVVEDCVSLFSARPSLEILRRTWRDDAGFLDPICAAYGFHEYAHQWFGMPVVFSPSRNLRAEVTTNDANVIEYRQLQAYTLRFLGLTVRMPSLVHIELDDADSITSFEDRWFGYLPTNGIAYLLRRLNARTMPYIIGVPQSDAEVGTKRA